jgi:hypothetical protein
VSGIIFDHFLLFSNARNMKKVIIPLLVLLVLTGPVVLSQDIIYYQDGSKEEVEVLEINSQEVSYKKSSNLEGPVYVIGRGEVVLITFANGEHELIGPVKTVKMQQDKPLTKDFASNIMAFHLFDLVFGDFAVSYERIIAGGRAGIKIPLAFGFYGYRPYDTPFNFNNLFYSGFGMNFYPTGQGRVRYFVGPQFRFGVGRSGDYYYYEDEYGIYYQDEYYETTSLYLKYLVDNGIMIMPVRNFSISAIFSLGVRFIPNAPSNINSIQPDAQFAINLGLRF